MKKQLTFLLAILFALTSCWSSETPIRFTRPVKVTQVVSLNNYDKDFVGIVSSEQTANLAFQVSGLINQIYVSSGSYVKKGQLLASIEPQDYKLQLDADRAQYQTSRSILERNERLAARQAISTQDLEIARANFQQAKSAYEYSQNQLTYTRMTAPFSGSIEAKYVDNYQKISAGETIFKLINPDQLDVSFTLSESDINITQVPAVYSIEFDNLRGKQFQARIKEVVDASVNGTGIPVRLSITDPEFKPQKYNIKAGFACLVNISIVDRPATKSFMKIPISALFAEPTDSTELFVWIYNNSNSTVDKRQVVLAGLSGTDQVIISSGIKTGDHVVIAGVYQLVNGQKVEVLK